MSGAKTAIAATVLFGACATIVHAACNEELITMVEWKIEPIDDETNLLTTKYTSNFDRPVRMIDASASFRDVLGGSIGSFALSRDVSLEPGEEFEEVGRWGPFTFERLLDLNIEDVASAVCVRGVVYADGEVERF